MNKKGLKLGWIISLIISIIALAVGASFHGLRMNPENINGYNLGVTMGITMIALFGIAFTVFIVLLVLYKRNK